VICTDIEPDLDVVEVDVVVVEVDVLVVVPLVVPVAAVGNSTTPCFACSVILLTHVPSTRL
jgi:hypothetical protein